MKRVLMVVGVLAALAGVSATAMAMDDAPNRGSAACGVARFVINNPGSFSAELVSSSFDYWRENCLNNDNGL